MLFTILFTAFDLPPTPPSSFPSDESEGNLTPEHRLSPTILSNSSLQITRRATTDSQNGNCFPAATPSNNTCINTRLYSGTNCRQPIHTPLISTQPVSI